MNTKALNLKQRLSALAQAPSQSTTRDNMQSKFTAGKRKLSAAWSKRSPPAQGNGESLHRDVEADKRVEDVISRMIYQAGVDFE